MAELGTPPVGGPAKKKYVRAIGPRLRLLLYFIFGLVALLGANSVYLTGITFLQWVTKASYENYFYQFMFLAHLVLGLLLVTPFVIFGALHIKNSHDRTNRRAVRVGYLLFAISLILLFTGIALMRFDFFVIKDPRLRSPIYWAHVITPVLAVWLYVLHRLAGPRIQWRAGLRWAAAVGLLTGATLLFHSSIRRSIRSVRLRGKSILNRPWPVPPTGNFIPAANADDG